MNKQRLTEIFNRGFRRGANDRAGQGLPLSAATAPPAQIPDCPGEMDNLSGQLAWTMGYATGYQVGASDAELTSVDEPGAHGLISGMSEPMLEAIGVFKKISDEH